MRETLFIKKNKTKWEALDARKTDDPDELNASYTQVLDDLAYAQTFYPRSQTRRYLNERAVIFYNKIYSRRKEKVSVLFRFFSRDLPLAIRHNHRQLFYSLLFFLVFALIGALSAKYDTSFLDLILGKNYVDMTINNIQSGDPFGVYKDDNYLMMFFGIAVNNILITIVLVYAIGAFFNIGTLYSLMNNGVMVGAFQYFFFRYNLGWESVLVIWVHGVLEISAIVIAGGAGLALGNSILFPGTLKRMDSLKKAAAGSAAILVMTVLMLLAAAWLESYVTHLASNNFSRHRTGAFMPWWGSFLILTGSLTFIVWYFIIYPFRAAARLKARVA